MGEVPHRIAKKRNKKNREEGRMKRGKKHISKMRMQGLNLFLKSIDVSNIIMRNEKSKNNRLFFLGL